MKQSNIFALIELTKLVEALGTDPSRVRHRLISNAAYFNIIHPRFFSQRLAGQWEAILAIVNQKGPMLDGQGRVQANAAAHTIAHLSEADCLAVAERIGHVHEKLKLEFTPA